MTVKPERFFFSLLIIISAYGVHAQENNRVLAFFPAGTILRGNIPYAADTLHKHQLDIYVPPVAKADAPLVIWIHGGAWMKNDKYADMGYMKKTIRTIAENGYVLASIDYRWSTQAAFPALIQDCNQAVEFLFEHAKDLKFDKNRIALIGFSAGGHLASLLALSNNDHVHSFYHDGKNPTFVIKAVVDFYGPSDFLAMIRSDPDKDLDNSVTTLLGASVLSRPDLARIASPVNYIDKNDPPFLIIQGEKDQSVPQTQSILLSSWLSLSGVKNQLFILPGAPHYGEMFDSEEIRGKVVSFLRENLK